MKNKLFFLLVVLILIAPTFVFFLSDKFYTFHDETQVGNLYHYFKAIGLGQFPPRWASNMHFGYGSPFLSFNYQLPYYVGYLLSLLGLPLVTIFKLLMAVSIVIGVVGMFFLGLFLTGSTLFSFFAAILYAYTPYQAVIHFVRGTLGEAFALGLFPWIFLASFSLAKKVTPNRSILLSVLLALLFLSHQPAALFAIPFFVLIFITPALLTQKYSLVFSYLKALTISFLLASFYIIPVLAEKGLIGATGPFNYIDHFPFIRQLMYSAWSYSGSNPFSSDTMSFQIGQVNLAIILGSVLFAVSLLRKKVKDNFSKLLFIALLFSTGLAIFLMNIRSDFLWRAVKLIQAIQFPWRLLMFTTFFTPVLFLLMVKELKTKWLTPLVVLLTIVSIILSANYFQPGKVTDRGDDYYLRRLLPTAILLPGETVSSDYLREAEDYAPLPALAIRPKNLPKAKITSDLPSTGIEITNDNPYRIEAAVTAKSSSLITIHTFLYPGWTVEVDGELTEVKPDEIGAITFVVSPGDHRVKVSYLDTPVRSISNIISLGTLIALGFFLITNHTKRDSSTT